VRLPRDTRRKTVRFSQEQLAERLNVASSTVARVKPEHDTETARPWPSVKQPTVTPTVLLATAYAAQGEPVQARQPSGGRHWT
jgi:transcriptional regulator with XRE-family HTH domain